MHTLSETGKPSLETEHVWHSNSNAPKSSHKYKEATTETSSKELWSLYRFTNFLLNLRIFLRRRSGLTFKLRHRAAELTSWKYLECIKCLLASSESINSWRHGAALAIRWINLHGGNPAQNLKRDDSQHSDRFRRGERIGLSSIDCKQFTLSICSKRV